MKRATIYMDEDLHKALKLRSAETSIPVSELVNDAVKASLAGERCTGDGPIDLAIPSTPRETSKGSWLSAYRRFFCL